MAGKDIPMNKVRELRKAKGLTLEQLADLVGVSLGKATHFTTIAKIERSQRPLSGDMLNAFSIALDVSPEQLVSTAPATIPVRMVPIIGRIAAGNWREAIQDPQGYLPAPIRSNNAFALRPEGTSMNLVVGEDAVIVVDPDQLDLLDGRLYAIMNSTGDTTFKRFRASPPSLEPVSSDPQHEPIMIGREPFTVLGRVIWQGSFL